MRNAFLPLVQFVAIKKTNVTFLWRTAPEKVTGELS